MPQCFSTEPGSRYSAASRATVSVRERLMALTFPRSGFSELRVPGVHGSPSEGVDFSAPLGRTPARGVVIEVERPGSELDRHSVIGHSVLTLPLGGRPGIAYARESPRLVSAQGLDGDPAGRSGFPTKGSSVSMQDQEPDSPNSPQEPMPGEPGTMPDEPAPAPRGSRHAR